MTTKTTTLDPDGNEVPRLDLLPRAEAADALGITTEELEYLMGQGFELYDPLGGWNNSLLSPEELARECGVSTRQLRNLEERGLPCVGSYQRKRYPYPLAEAWVRIFRLRSERYRGTGHRVHNLDPHEALEEYKGYQAVSRAYCRLWRPEWYTNTPLDAEAEARMPEARQLIAAGRTPLSWKWG